jgi:hypothetical protein
MIVGALVWPANDLLHIELVFIQLKRTMQAYHYRHIVIVHTVVVDRRLKQM